MAPSSSGKSKQEALRMTRRLISEGKSTRSVAPSFTRVYRGGVSIGLDQSNTSDRQMPPRIRARRGFINCTRHCGFKLLCHEDGTRVWFHLVKSMHSQIAIDKTGVANTSTLCATSDQPPAAHLYGVDQSSPDASRSRESPPRHFGAAPAFGSSTKAAGQSDK